MPYSGKTTYSYIYSYIKGNIFLDFDFFFKKIYNINIEVLLNVRSNELYLRSFESCVIKLLISADIYFSLGGGFFLSYFNIYIVLYIYMYIVLISRLLTTPNTRTIYSTINIYKLYNERFSFIKLLPVTGIVND
ncbi:shikimate kinase [Candidatus Vidania fulgoroideorum]